MSEIHDVMNEIVRALGVRQEDKDVLHERIDALAAGDQPPAAEEDAKPDSKTSGRTKGDAPA